MEAAEVRLVHFKNSSSVVKLPTVVRSTEDGYQLALSEKLIPILDNLHSSEHRKVRQRQTDGCIPGVRGRQAQVRFA